MNTNSYIDSKKFNIFDDGIKIFLNFKIIKR